LKFGDFIPFLCTCVLFKWYCLRIFIMLFRRGKAVFGKITTPLLHLLVKMDVQINHETKSLYLL